MTNLVTFEHAKIRKVWHDEQWYFSVVDIIAILTDSSNSTDYLKKLRKRDSEFGTYLGKNCPQVEMMAETGKNEKHWRANSKKCVQRTGIENRQECGFRRKIFTAQEKN